MAKKTIEPNPYDVLEISPDASTTEIPKAFAMAMKRRKYPADAIAKARKCLMNPKERIIADYLRPILPKDISEFKREEVPGLKASETTLEFLPEFDGLESAIADANRVSDLDKRVGLTLLNFFNK